jgi:hypothetical protein
MLVGLLGLFGELLRVGSLARTAGAAEELAAFAIAGSIVAGINASLIYIPQLPHVFARCEASRRVCRNFILFICSILTIPLFVLGYLGSGRALIAYLFSVEAFTLEAIVIYFQILTPGILLLGIHGYWTGLLMQANRTHLISFLGVGQLILTACILWGGLRSGMQPIVCVALSQVIPLAVACMGGFFIFRRKPLERNLLDQKILAYREVFAFFWPASLSAWVFVLNRPVVFSFLSREPHSIAMVAGLRVALDVSLVFFQAMNQLRSVYVAFGVQDILGVQNFVWKVLGSVAAVMVLLVFTPLGEALFGTLLGLTGSVKVCALQSFSILCLIPLLLAARSHLHGKALLERSTRRMGVAGFASLGLVYLLTWIFSERHMLNSYTAAGAMVAAFFAEVAALEILRRFFSKKSIDGIKR